MIELDAASLSGKFLDPKDYYRDNASAPTPPASRRTGTESILVSSASCRRSALCSWECTKLEPSHCDETSMSKFIDLELASSFSRLHLLPRFLRFGLLLPMIRLSARRSPMRED